MKKISILIFLFIEIAFAQLPWWADKNINGNGNGGAAYSEEALVYFRQLDPIPGDTLTPGASDTLDAIAKFIDSINVYHAIYDSLDEMWLYAMNNETNAVKGMKGYVNCVTVNSPAFTAYQGFTSNGTSSYINTTYNPSTDAIRWRLATASYGLYSRTDNQDLDYEMGQGLPARMRIRTSTDGFGWRVNGTGTVTASGVAASLGFFAGSRISQDTIWLYINDTKTQAAAGTVSGIGDKDIFVCRVQETAAYSTRQYSFVFVGGALTHTQGLYFYQKLEELLDFLGAGVVE